jgi:peptide-methionine (S)-S-oxide reductase
VEKKATFGAGCFWGVEAAFRQLEGVTRTRVGYSGGTTENPTYEDVCSHTTGHAEVVEVTYDPDRISYEQLLDVFWAKHDPTQLNRQGWDIGDNYRSAIFFHDEEQHEAALKSKAGEQRNWGAPIVTEVEPAQTFYEAEDYHQQYLEKRGRSEVEGRRAAELGRADRDGGRACADLLRGRGLPPAVPREARPLELHAGAAARDCRELTASSY